MIKRNGDNVFAIASNNQCQGARSSVPLWPGGGSGGGGTRIPRASAVRMTPPDAHHNTKEANIALSTYVEKWKNRYEEAERKHKAYLLKSEKAKREYDDLQRRYNIVAEERNHLDSELRERERELSRLKTVSEKLFTEYQQLKNQHEVDSGVMQKVMQQAGEWYKQNKQLKRRSTVLLQALPTKGVDIDFTDSTDTASDTSSNEEVEFLKQTVQELSRQVAALQTDLNTAKLQEFEAQEANVALTQELESTQSRCSSQEKQLLELRSQLERLERMSALLIDEVKALKDNADKDREMAATYKSEARLAKKRVKELVHQSALLAGDVSPGGRLQLLMDEVEQLSAALALQNERHVDQLEELQLKLAEKHEDTDILLWEEKIKLAEEDAQKAIERAEQAERRLAELQKTIAENKEKKTTAEDKMTSTNNMTMTADTLTATNNATDDKMTDVKQTVTDVKLTDKVSDVKEEKFRPPKRSNLMSRICYFENGCAEVKDEKVEQKIEEKTEDKTEVKEDIVVVQETKAPEAPPPPACPPPPPAFLPPPPPPPPPPPMAAACQLVPGVDMATMLASKQGTLKKCVQNGGGAIDAIVDQIKGGKFHLKSTEQNFASRKPRDEQPEAVKEMLAILGTLRKRRVHRHSVASDSSL